MRILVAGGTGVLGRRMLPDLARSGHSLAVMTRDPGRARDLVPNGVDIVPGDVLDAAAVDAAMSANAPDVVIHQLTDLSRGDRQANARLRITGTRNLVEACLRLGVERLVAQSIAWAYEPGDGPAAESTPFDLASPSQDRRDTVQAVATLEEQVARVPQGVILRCGMLYGPDTWYSPQGMMADLARDGRLPASPDIVSFVHVDDAARAAVDALDWPAGPVNVVDDEPAAGSSWVPAFARAVGAPEPAHTRDREPWARGATNDRAGDLGWRPRYESWRVGFGAVERT
jgi:nucleoside-diphosphate-sugar epimerase